MNESTQTDFAASAQRFKEAVESLADLRSKVGIIDSFRAQQEKSTDSLSEWTSTLESVTNELSQVGNLGEQVLGSLNKAIAKATSALQQETVQAIHEDLTGFQAKSDAQHDATTKALASAVDDLVGVGELGKEILGLLQEVVASSANAAKQEIVQAIHDDLTKLNGEYGDQQKSTQEAIQGLREELKSIHNAHSATQHELNEIQKKVRDLPSRIRRKHGL